MFIYSFLVAATYGGVEWTFTTEAYVSFLFQRDIFDDTLQFVPDYLQIYLAHRSCSPASPPSPR